MKNLLSQCGRDLVSASLATLLVSLLPAGCKSSDGTKGSGLWGTAGSEAGGGSDGGESGNGAARAGADAGGENGTGGKSTSDCATNADCALGEQCVDGDCLGEEACRNSLGCETPLVCSTAGRCVECVDDVECGKAEKCVGNACRSSCTSDRNCTGFGLLCDRDVGSCVECLVAEDCPDGRGCTNGTCVTTVLGTGGSAGAAGEGEGGTSRGGRGAGLGGTDSGRGGDAAEGGNTAQAGTGEAVGGTGEGRGGSAGSASTEIGGRSANGGDTGAAGQLGEGGTVVGSGGTPVTGGAPGAGGATLGFCGDGRLDAGESCDDANTKSGDCCSSACEVESGCQCTQATTDAPSLVLPAIHRDFRAGGDFEPMDAVGLNDATIGLVAPALDVDGRPEFVGLGGDGFITSAASFAEWYRDVPGTNETLQSTLVLFRDASGDYVNRYGVSGEQWSYSSTLDGLWCGVVGEEVTDADGNPIACTYCLVDEDPDTAGCQGGETPECEVAGAFDACVVSGETYYGVHVTVQDGSPLFFPVDTMEFTPADERSAAVIPPYYGGYWTYEDGEPLHNFHFTSEFHVSLQFTGNQVLEVGGDDDVWVFIDGKLAADVGGIHTPVNATITLDSMGDATTVVEPSEPAGDTLATTTTVTLGLSVGQVYDVAIFQAERKTESSTFRVKLRNFELGTSQCTVQSEP
jgi:fibro-slime domain-containing protein